MYRLVTIKLSDNKIMTTDNMIPTKITTTTMHNGSRTVKSRLINIDFRLLFIRYITLMKDAY